MLMDTHIENEKQFMTIEFTTRPDSDISCSNCEACCCRLEVMLITDTGVTDNFIEFDKWGGMTMARLDDGWCSALDRNTMSCMIYEKRPKICRDFVMGESECVSERAVNL